jgi:hypothetical protein
MVFSMGFGPGRILEVFKIYPPSIQHIKSVFSMFIRPTQWICIQVYLLPRVDNCLMA